MTKQNKGTHRDRVHKDDWSINKKTGRVTVTLKPGFAFEPNRDELKALHFKGFPTAREAKKAVIASLPCNCDRCAMGGKSKVKGRNRC